MIGGLCYLVFSVELDPVVFELTAVKEMPVGATQNDRLSEIEQIRIDPHSGAESIVYVNGRFRGTESVSSFHFSLFRYTVYRNSGWKNFAHS